MPTTDQQRPCDAEGCLSAGVNCAIQAQTGRYMYLCGNHMNYHGMGIGFELRHEAACEGCILRGYHGNPTFEEEFGKLAKPLLTKGQLCGIVNPTSPTTQPEEAAMYSTISKAISILQDSLSEANDALEEVQQKKSELDDAESELENMIDQLTSAIGAIEELDGASVSVDVDGVSVYISL